MHKRYSPSNNTHYPTQAFMAPKEPAWRSSGQNAPSAALERVACSFLCEFLRQQWNILWGKIPFLYKQIRLVRSLIGWIVCLVVAPFPAPDCNSLIVSSLPAVAGSLFGRVQSQQLRRTESPNPPVHSAAAAVLTATTKETPCIMKSLPVPKRTVATAVTMMCKNHR